MNIWANCPWICKTDTHIFILSVKHVMPVWKWWTRKVLTDVGCTITNETIYKQILTDVGYAMTNKTMYKQILTGSGYAIYLNEMK